MLHHLTGGSRRLLAMDESNLSQQLPQNQQQEYDVNQPHLSVADIALSQQQTLDPHSISQSQLTVGQTALLIGYTLVALLWVLEVLLPILFSRRNLGIFRLLETATTGNSSRPNNNSNNKSSSNNSSCSKSTIIEREGEKNHSNDAHVAVVDVGEKSSVIIIPDTGSASHRFSETSTLSSEAVAVGSNGVKANVHDRYATRTARKPGGGHSSTFFSSTEKKPTSSNTSEIPSYRTFLNNALLFGAILIFFFACDYRKVFMQGERMYHRDTFLFLVFLLFLVASAFTITPNQDKILNREQTEEWKGWMQVMFVWYHYFKAKEWYNWIRVYIACYVWMTGFGNFSFFWVRKDYSLWRLTKMLFRLNFLVIFVSMATNNEYMLYYICAMHTYWFLTVYLFMRVLSSWNTQPTKMAAKFAMYALCNAIIFDIPGISENVFRPLHFVLGFHDKSKDIMHEWSFRAGLDHWACFVGMLCAYNFPHFEALMTFLDSISSSSAEQAKKRMFRVGIGVSCLLVGVLWYFMFARMEKFAYNSSHPYSSMIPVVIFIIGRNIHPVLRRHHIHMFSWLGKITLETYLSQLHIYLLSNARTLLMYIPDYPLLNFSLATIIYITVSYLLFNITVVASNYLLAKEKDRWLVCVGCALLLFSVPVVINHFWALQFTNVPV